MPITFIDIERQKSARIAFLFIFLLIIYFLLAVSLYFGITVILFPIMMAGRSLGMALSHIAVIFVCSLLVAAVHFWFSSTSILDSIKRNLGALAPDPKDGIHKRLLNIMDEIRIASGGKKNIRCFVIPTLSMNALAADDLKGEAVIAITEGLLSRLSREQLEAVIAHEAYHILSGDCRETTLAASLFGMYATFLDKMQSLSEDNRRRDLSPSFIPLWILLKLSSLLSMFISREREYRADAASVRMTRNPLAMAEALYLLSRNWTGGGFISEGIEMLCIVSPVAKALDEADGWWADLMSTHPPISRRMNLLLRMAHSSIGVLQRKETAEKKVQKESASGAYYALDSMNVWQGPFTLLELMAIPWFSPQTWISDDTGSSAMKVSENPGMLEAFLARYPVEKGAVSSGACPSCRQPLNTTDYEQTTVRQCRYCGGILVENSKIPRLIIRREKKCTERVNALARAVITDNQRAFSISHLTDRKRPQRPATSCSLCSRSMFRTFYSGAYLIEIDRCSFCGVTWFDADELEMLQCLIENKITGTVEAG